MHRSEFTVPTARDAVKGFSAFELDRLSGCLARLAPHVRGNEIAVTGGVAIQLGLAALGRDGGREQIADLDLIASDLHAVADTVSETFLVSHYHVPQPDAPKFMVQLVDPISRIRVDIFPDLVGSLKRGQRTTIEQHAINVLTLEDILDHKLLTISRASDQRPIDPKHYLDARVLGALFGRAVPPVPATWLVKDVYGTAEDIECRRCALSRNPRFPLAPKAVIVDLLGWS